MANGYRIANIIGQTSNEVQSTAFAYTVRRPDVRKKDRKNTSNINRSTLSIAKSANLFQV
jgi:hypothetical protein